MLAGNGSNPTAEDDVPPVTLSREAEVLLLLVDIPIDNDWGTDHFDFDPEMVSLAVRKLGKFSNDELEAGIAAYRDRMIG